LWSNLCGDSLVYGRSGGLAAFVGATLLVALLAAGAQAEETVMLDGYAASTDSVLVKWKDAAPSGAAARGLSTATKDTVLSKVDGVVAINEFSELPGLATIELAPAVSSRAAARSAKDAEFESVQQLKKRIAELEATGLFEHVEPDWIQYALNTPNDAGFTDGRLWGLRNTGQAAGSVRTRSDPADGIPGADIRATGAWQVTTGSPNVIVAVIDSGVRYTHEDLAANMWRNPGEIPGNGRDDDGNGYIDDVHGIDAIANSGNPSDRNGHGTHCAGTIGAVANGGGPAVGVAWNVRLMALKFLDGELGGRAPGNTSDAIECINYAVRMGAHIMNNSWGGGPRSELLLEAIRAANARGILFVAAAGNNGRDNDRTDTWPANYDVPNIVSVAAIDRRDGLADFSNFGRQKVHLGAPGVGIFSTFADSNSGYTAYQGTSMAAPHVSGVAALVKARFPSANAAEMKQRILSSVVPISSLRDRTITGGRLDAQGAVGGAPGGGGLQLRAVPETLPLPAGDNVVMRVEVTDLGPVLNASVTARFGSNPSVTLRDNGLAPDEAANDGIYAGNMLVPSSGATVRLTVNASAAGKQPAQATFDFSVVQRISNDNFANRAALAAGTVRATGSNLTATRESGEPRQPSVAGDATVWWSWRAPASASATITTAGSDFDTTLAVYRGDSLGQLTLLGANDDSAGVTSAVSFQAQQGVVYAIQVSGWSRRTGNIVLNYPAPGGAAAPVIVEEPAPVSVLLGSPFNIRVVATGATGYQWFRNNVAVSGATNPEYNVERSTLADDGTYRVVVSNSSGSTSSRDVRVAINQVDVNPDNDFFARRQQLTGFSGRVTASNANATGETGEPNHAGVSTPLNSMWFEWQAPSAGELILDTVGSNFDTTLAVYRGNAVNALTAVASNDDAEGRQSRVRLTVTAGTTYMVAVDGYSSRTGSIVLNHTFTPSEVGGGANNDSFANRIAVVPNRDYTGSNASATGETGEPNHAGRSTPLNSIWWQWTATGNGAVEIVTTGSNFDTTLAAYTGNAVNSLREIASNDDYSGLQSRIQFQVRAGERYMIAVDGYGSARGDVRLRLGFTPNFNFRLRPDFDNNSHADFIWHHSTDGRVAAWLRDQNNAHTVAYLGRAGASWSIVGSGDFNNDGQSDMLWRHSLTGEAVVWLMNGTLFARGATVASVGMEWEISALGDFNGDSQSDILWRRSSDGLLLAWLMNGTSVQSMRVVGQMTDPNWQIVGTGDFDRRGPSDDIVWHHRGNGGLVVWNMNGTTRVSHNWLGILGDLRWSVASIGDFNGDEQPDILWHRASDGATVAWHMVNYQRTGASYLATAPTGWRLRNR
jgi:thermitase